MRSCSPEGRENQFSRLIQKQAAPRICLEVGKMELTAIEKQLLLCAADSGEIRVHYSAQIPKWVTAGNQTFGFEPNPTVGAQYVQAV